MKSIFIAGSRKFYNEIQELVKKLKKEKVEVKTSGKWNKGKKDTLKSEGKALLGAFKGIDNADITYVYSKRGYIGNTVAMEIAYAHAKKKEIISSEPIKELSAKAFVKKIFNISELIDYCK